ncbi:MULTISPECIES: ABC transporter substrate-binding protein [unclassified Methylobacterium]|jgi:NitT/TauT family transport system substrate-binding protein|uniref:ABC transporter substrate-binding protein n=1 Tax=unclassified Methylobacterium TaxID=2615210 RepID=UPI001352D0FF|nr:ABC transporter substrate-binding protein [Methylobacterium sp. 2A]MWV20527.1 ABC transporter substrate-binding protein [Methylobacterium sp. 2A]
MTDAPSSLGSSPTGPLPSRRRLLQIGAAAAALPLGVGTGLAWAPGPGAPFDPGPLCRPAAAEVPAGPLRPITLAWSAVSICTAAAPLAKERGIFARHGLDVNFINFGGVTETLLEAIATGKADAGIGMALRWLKPLEQGFDVKITAGLHGGCMRLLAAKSAGITGLAGLKGKTIAISDQASPAKNFFGLMLAQAGIDPESGVEWRQYPADLLNLAVEKGEAQALADADPRTYLWLKDPRLTEIATNLSGAYADRTCCIVAVRGSLIRDERPVAAALTRAILEGGHLVHHEPEAAARAFSGYGGKGSVEDLAAMLRSHTHGLQPVGAALKQQLALYGEELKLVNVFKRSTDTAKFAERVYVDVLS